MEAVYKVWVQGDQLDTMLKQVIDWNIHFIDGHINEYVYKHETARF